MMNMKLIFLGTSQSNITPQYHHQEAIYLRCAGNAIRKISHCSNQRCQRDFVVSPIICQNFPPKSNKIPHYNKNSSIPRQSAARAKFYSADPRCQQFFHAAFLPPTAHQFFYKQKNKFYRPIFSLYCS